MSGSAAYRLKGVATQAVTQRCGTDREGNLRTLRFHPRQRRHSVRPPPRSRACEHSKRITRLRTLMNLLRVRGRTFVLLVGVVSLWTGEMGAGPHREVRYFSGFRGFGAPQSPIASVCSPPSCRTGIGYRHSHESPPGTEPRIRAAPSPALVVSVHKGPDGHRWTVDTCVTTMHREIQLARIQA